MSATITTLNAELLLADDAPAPTGEETPSVVPVPSLTSVAIGICVAFTVVFGIVPAPLLDFANHATLLFFGRLDAASRRLTAALRPVHAAPVVRWAFAPLLFLPAPVTVVARPVRLGVAAAQAWQARGRPASAGAGISGLTAGPPAHPARSVAALVTGLVAARPGPPRGRPVPPAWPRRW